MDGERDTSHLERIAELCSEASIASSPEHVSLDHRLMIEQEVWADFQEGQKWSGESDEQIAHRFQTWRKEWFGDA